MVKSIMISSGMTLEQVAAEIVKLPEDRALRLKVKHDCGLQYLYIRPAGKAENLLMRLIGGNTYRLKQKAVNVINKIHHNNDRKYNDPNLRSLKRLMGAIKFNVPLNEVENIVLKRNRSYDSASKSQNKMNLPALGKGLDY